MSDEKKSQAEQIADAVKQAISEALPAAAAIAAQVTANNQPKQAQTYVPPSRRGAPKCEECKQYKEACKDQHAMMCVWPDDDEAAQWFTGVKLNGVRYMSNGPGHMITVPKKNNIGYILAKWTENERVQRRGRKVSHNSGQIGGGTNNFNAFNKSGFGER